MSVRKHDDELEGDQPEEFDRDLPDESDMDDDDQPDIIPCPFCRRPITEDAVRCHHCGRNVEDAPAQGGTTSLVVVFIIAFLIIAAALGWLFGR